MPATRNVIIFGATGAVGSSAALKAHQEGAKVSLAMRDPSKPIPILSGISAERVQADLTNPETIRAAVQQTGAKFAFIYAAFGTSDHMRSSIEALKEAGIEFVVFLSSYAIDSSPHRGDARAVPPSDFIPWVHAQIELVLEDVFGKDAFVAVRPAYFASNLHMMKNDIVKEDAVVRHANPEAEFDWISPYDIGQVAGAVLAHSTNGHIVGLVGPERMSVRDALGHVGRVLGKEIKVTTIPKEEAVDGFKQHGIPPPVAEWLVNDVTETPGAFFRAPTYQEAAGNIQKYTQKDPVRFEQWIAENKQMLEA
ncbi:uncharacterized protein N7459_001173 [Penicillium hispanicum]|uniref:uncharacterized protein n=1 Tax=Penicillium hispanicum TaxID=1080232 RepID=UPI002541A67B|nr:uncharacterized protein N7459_001173 [Penicillium hispanicum]KAJ5594965.1 hypothetical protein N7459_001173 [Penicillium hispanicum]